MMQLLTLILPSKTWLFINFLSTNQILGHSISSWLLFSANVFGLGNIYRHGCMKFVYNGCHLTPKLFDFLSHTHLHNGHASFFYKTDMFRVSAATKFDLHYFSSTFYKSAFHYLKHRKRWVMKLLYLYFGNVVSDPGKFPTWANHGHLMQ